MGLSHISCMDSVCNNSVKHDFCMITSSLYFTHTDNCKVLQLSSAFQNRFNHKDQGGSPIPRKGHLLIDGYKKSIH
jgi:hypothetical protein